MWLYKAKILGKPFFIVENHYYFLSESLSYIGSSIREPLLGNFTTIFDNDGFQGRSRIGSDRFNLVHHIQSFRDFSKHYRKKKKIIVVSKYCQSSFLKIFLSVRVQFLLTHVFSVEPRCINGANKEL